MINVLIPIAGKSMFFDENVNIFPKPLTEICGKTMIEHCMANLASIPNARFIFVLRSMYAHKYHLDKTIRLLNPASEFIILKDDTAGMACSALFAIDYINNENELIICNVDQIFNCDLNLALRHFSDFSAGVICFPSIHPRYAYALLDKNNCVVQVAEKVPLSKNAIAGFFYFKKGQYFIESSMQMIYKEIHHEGRYYIAPCLNEMILKNQKIAAYIIRAEHYHTFYSPAKITEFERIQKCLSN